MGRGRVELKRIENKINRQVSFSKRRSGLLKKAREISVLCDADVALLVFSPKGKLLDFSNQPSVERILERYERHSYAGRQDGAGDQAPNENWVIEQERLKDRVEVLQQRLRNFMGEELHSLNLRGLQRLEQQLDSALKHIRSRKNQIMHESISELQKKCTHLTVTKPLESLNIGGSPKGTCSEGTPTSTQPKTILPPWMITRPTDE